MSDSAPRVSIIIPARNCPDQVRSCLESLRASDYPNFEAIVVDDASTDDTAAVAERLADRCVRLATNSGPAAARNRGAEIASGEFVFFVDADVCLNIDTIRRAVEGFEKDPAASAIFGSYDLSPREPNLLSKYKNLYHHYVHQISSEQAWTFWSGCGMIRRSVFLEAGGFDESYARPCVEDIELGARLHRAGHRILLKKDMQATHLKKWTLWGIVKSDVRDRAIPWTQLLLREKSLPNDLNLRVSQRVCTILAFLLVGTWLIGSWFAPALLALPLLLVGLHLIDSWSGRRRVSWFVAALACLVPAAVGIAIAWFFEWWALIPLGLLLAIVLLNLRLYLFFAQRLGVFFALLAVPMQVLYYFYCGVGLMLGILSYRMTVQPAARLARSENPVGAPR